ncbi:MAG: cupin domain-containing protein [Candidatus Lokiarchaeota archaeon]|nr:cupin domain-containing protein [Candidatus Lokiarchaeota archaeon]MBD3200460.1 cupin domain-containing protein [Candidatus Lokiarchaeota archaeon]
MIKKNILDVNEEVVKKANSNRTKVRWLITEQDGSENLATRRFEIAPGGEVGLHEHQEDHNIYVIEGKADFISQNGKTFTAVQDEAVYIPPHEEHGIQNKYDCPFIFICVIPYY